MFKLLNSIPNKLLAIGAVMAVVIIVLFGLDYYQKSQQVEGLSDGELLKVSKENIVDYQVINANGDQAGDIIKYHYISNIEVPPQTYEGLKEDLAKRTNNSITFLESIEPINDKFQKEKYVSRFYSGRTWQKSGNKWYQVETATTTKTAFLNQTKLTALDRVKEFFGRTVLADTIFSGAGDGEVEKSDSTNWATTHDALTGEIASSIDASVYTARQAFTTNYAIHRAFLPFDTSAISGNAMITAASVNIFVALTYDGGNDGYDYINVVQTFQPDSTTLTTADYDLLGTSVGGTNLELLGMATGTYKTINLNSTGFTWIVRSGEASSCGITTGVSCLGLKEGHDIGNVANETLYTGLNFITSEQAGTSQDPYLSVTYTVIAPSKVVIDGSTIKIDGGTLKID